MKRTLISEICVPGNPKVKQRPRFTATGVTYTPAATVRAERDLGWLFKQDLIDRGQASDPDPRSCFAVQVQIHELRTNGKQVDGDNVLKLVCDALNGVVWVDDRQVTEMHAYIRDRESRNPRTEITIWRLED